MPSTKRPWHQATRSPGKQLWRVGPSRWLVGLWCDWHQASFGASVRWRPWFPGVRLFVGPLELVILYVDLESKADA